MHSKIKEIRMRLSLSEVQISSLLNISSYKYKRYENGTLEIPAEVVVLLSVMYDIAIDLFVYDRFSSDAIFIESSMEKILQFPKEERFSVLETNMSRYSAFACNVISYRVVKNILAVFLNVFSKNLYNLRHLELLEISEISTLLHINVERYIDIESGAMWPTVYELIKIASVFSCSINELLEIKNETDF